MPEPYPPECWNGSYYELAIDFSAQENVVQRALTLLWSDPHLEGPWSRRELVGLQPPVPAALREEPFALYGSLLLSQASRIGCMSWLVRDPSRQDADSLTLSVPAGMLHPLGLVAPLGLGEPFDPGDDPVLVSLNECFLAIAQRLYAAVPFDLALLGEEAAVQNSLRNITGQWVEQHGGCLLSPALRARLAPHVPVRQLRSGLCWIPFAGSGANPRA